VAVFRNISLVYGAIHRFEGQVSVFNFNNSGTYRCAFPEMKLLDKAPSCEEVGVIGVLPGIIGLYQAMEAIKIITGIGKVLADEILMLNLLQTSHVKISYTRNSDEIEIARNRIIEMQNKNEFVNKILDKSEVPAFLVANPTTNVIDIQMDFTYKVWMGVSVLHMPEYAFVQKVQQLDRQCNVLVYCANGIKSTWAAAVMKSLGFKNIYQLSGGIASVIE
jgi:adenylyltransferase/sulfurtransferase